MILDGRVSVNGEIVNVLGTQVDEQSDTVQVDGCIVRPEAEKHYLAYNKPVGEVTTVSDPEGRATVMDRFRDYPVRLFPVGRLDYDSEGLLLLTNDGDLMNRLLHPSFEIQKAYLTPPFYTDQHMLKLQNYKLSLLHPYNIFCDVSPVYP